MPNYSIQGFTTVATPRFVLRRLTPDDATERYSGWFSDPAASKYIVAARKPHDVRALRAYIEDRMKRDDVLFLGIFVKGSATHIGNIKYEPIRIDQGYAVMGILIGDAEWRGKGVAQEVIRASSSWLKVSLGIREVLLGVVETNEPAISSYQKIGFKSVSDGRISTQEGVACMVWRMATEEE